MSKFMKWIDNFWYHHKWKVLIGGFFLAVFILCTVQMCNKEEYDAHIIYAGPKNISTDLYHPIKDGFSSLLPGDYNRDGKQIVDFTDVVYVPQDLAEEYQKSGINYDAYRNAEARTQFQNEMMSGQCLICLMDADLYLETVDKGFFAPLSDLFDVVPEYALDEYAFMLSDLPFYNNTEWAKNLPGETILVMRTKNSAVSKATSNWNEIYSYHENLFRILATGKQTR